MTPAGALHVLGLDRDARWVEIRARHRSLIRAAHPDVGGDVARAAELNEALAILERATGQGDRRLPPPVPGRSPATDVDRVLHLDVAPSDLVMQLAEAAHSIGEVVYVDPHAGLLEVVVGDRAQAAHLVVSVGDVGPNGVPVAFTLEPLDNEADPPLITTVVDALVAEVSAGR